MRTRNLKILEICPNTNDATSFYRGRGPLAHLQKEYPVDIIPVGNSKVSWSSLMLFDVVFMQRPYNKDHLTLLKMAKNMGIPVWVDYDDNLFSVPRDNPCFELYNKDEVKKCIASIISLSDIVTVSTKPLKDFYSKLNKNITVVRNAYNHCHFSMGNAEKAKKQTIFWRGSNTHHGDILSYYHEIYSAIKDYPKNVFVFIGMDPHYFHEPLVNEMNLKPGDNPYVYSPGLDTIEYFTYIKKLNPLLFQVPLKKSVFNESKSDITFLEATHAGSVALVPDWYEWSRPGAIKYTDNLDYGEKLRAIMNGDIDNVKMQKEAKEYIMDKRTLRKANEIRWELLKNLMDLK